MSTQKEPRPERRAGAGRKVDETTPSITPPGGMCPGCAAPLADGQASHAATCSTGPVCTWCGAKAHLPNRSERRRLARQGATTPPGEAVFLHRGDCPRQAQTLRRQANAGRILGADLIIGSQVRHG